MTYNTKSLMAQGVLTGWIGLVIGVIGHWIDLPTAATLSICFVAGFLLGIIFEHDRDEHHFHEKYPFASKDFPS